MSNIEVTADLVQKHIYFNATASSTLQIMCNECSSEPYVIFFEGKDWEAIDTEVPWLANAITHLVDNHPEVF